MKILVAGKGFIGAAAGEKLEKSHEVKYLDRSDADYEQDITESFSIEEEFDVLVHTVGLPPGFATREEYRKVHVEGTKNLINAIDADKIVYLSALGAGRVDHPFFSTKKKAEEEIGSSGMTYTILRPSTVYGEGNKLLEMIRRFAPLRAFPDIRTETQPIDRDDLVDAVTEVVEGYENEILDLAGPEKMTVGEMAQKIYSEEGYSCHLIPFPEFLIELQLTGLSFMGPPMTRENMEIVRSSNTTEYNAAERILGDLRRI